MFEDLTAVVARTALVVRVEWNDLHGVDNAARSASLLRREIRARDGKAQAFWAEITQAPAGVDELDPSFQSVLGLRSDGPSGSPWSAVALRATRAVVDAALADSRLVGRRRDEARLRPVVKDVDLMLFPLAAGALVLHIDWVSQAGERVSVTELINSLSHARHVHKSDYGWAFDRAVGNSQWLQLSGPLLEARPGCGAATLADIADWLLVSAEESPHEPPRRVGPSRNAFHQTAVVLDATTPPEHLDDLLFVLRRGARADNVAPPAGTGPDRVLATRGNRRIGLSREGCVQVSWLDPAANTEFERNQAPQRFGSGVYFYLMLHAQAERATLARLAADAQGPARSLTDIHAVVDQRDALFELARESARYSLALVGDDCGGTSDYAWFFREVRDVLGTGPQLAEVRAEIASLFELVEAAQSQREADAQAKIAALGGAAVPFGIVTGVLGVNGPPGSNAAQWWGLLAGGLVFSTLGWLAAWRWWIRRAGPLRGIIDPQRMARRASLGTLPQHGAKTLESKRQLDRVD